MSNLEHYFENLLFLSKDVNGDLSQNGRKVQKKWLKCEVKE